LSQNVFILALNNVLMQREVGRKEPLFADIIPAINLTIESVDATA
jgi:hypothetical protein